MTSPHDRPARQASPRRRPITAVVVGAMLLAAALGFGAGPAGAAVPDAPVFFYAAGYSDGVRLYFAPPDDTGGKPVRYRINREIKLDGDTTSDAVADVDSSAMYVDDVQATGGEVTYFVYAFNDDGASAVAKRTVTTSASNHDLVKFLTPSTFVIRQYQDFLGRNPSPGELAAATATVGPGKTAANSAFMTKLIEGTERAARQRVIRLYIAYFKRGPDHGGLDYWTKQLEAGKKTINDVSNSFARSNEFKTTYGSLSNTEFVTLVYANVLEREPEPSGFQFWVGQLDEGRAIRGRVMTQFSESGEFRTTSKGLVQASDAWDAMLGTNIPVANLGWYSDHIRGGGNIGDITLGILTVGSYKGDG